MEVESERLRERYEHGKALRRLLEEGGGPVREPRAGDEPQSSELEWLRLEYRWLANKHIQASGAQGWKLRFVNLPVACCNACRTGLNSA